MANNKNPNEKLSGKTVKTSDEGSEKKIDVDTLQSRDEALKEHS
jgi:hypothetical protein